MKFFFYNIFIVGFLFASSSFGAFSTVVIDAGHGGHDRGGIPGQRIAEKGMTLDVAKRLRDSLQNAGVRTVMTRVDDRFISLGTRVAIANKQRNAIFVSVHFNAASRRGACGFETFYYSSKSASIASKIQSRILRVYNTENRGVKKRGFYVLRNNRLPAVLVECGFLTNSRDAALIKTATHRQQLAEAIASAILSSR